MFQSIVNALTGDRDGDGDVDGRPKSIKGTVVLMKKNVLDLNDLGASFVDRLHELVGKKVSLQLISSVNVDHGQYSNFYLSLSFWCFVLCFNFHYLLVSSLGLA